jgi:hypothetical protein
LIVGQQLAIGKNLTIAGTENFVNSFGNISGLIPEPVSSTDTITSS